MFSWIGWFQKISIPYHGWHEYFNPPLPSEIPKCLSPPYPPNSKIANPPPPPEFSTFVSDPLEFLFVCLNLQTNKKLGLFCSAKEYFLFINSFELSSASKGTLLDFTTYMLAWKLAWNTKSVRRSIWKRESGASFQHATTHRRSTIGEKHRLSYIFINQLSN